MKRNGAGAACLGVVLAGLCSASSPGQVLAAAEFGFNRIIPGWTNYSTAFNSTHDSAADGEFATVASLFTPPVNVRPIEYGAVMVWAGSGGQRLNFSDFTFQVFFWSSLEAFVRDPRRGDLATFGFTGPTGGSTTVPDTVTRGGRPAFHLRFYLGDNSLVLTQCHTWVVGVAATADPNQSGEMFVPTAPHEGLSDVQAGNIVPFGWIYLANAGGQTIYSGQLATELETQPLSDPPRLDVQRIATEVCLTWPATAGCFRVESSASLGSPSGWSLIEAFPAVENGFCRLCLPAAGAARWFRLKWEDASAQGE